MKLVNQNDALYTRKEEKKRGDSYAEQLIVSHKKRFEKFINSLDIKIKERLIVKALYKEILNQKNIYNYYDVDIIEFTMSMIQGKLNLVARKTQ